jgi:hypothetical protein
LTKSQPRSLLSIAKSNRARSRTRPSRSSQKRMAQTCCGLSARFAPRFRPEFHGLRSRKPGSYSECPRACLQRRLIRLGEEDTPGATTVRRSGRERTAKVWIRNATGMAARSFPQVGHLRWGRAEGRHSKCILYVDAEVATVLSILGWPSRI